MVYVLFYYVNQMYFLLLEDMCLDKTHMKYTNLNHFYLHGILCYSYNS